MDLYAYSQIKNLEHILTKNNIEIRRLRGLRLMKDEEPITSEEIEKIVKDTKLENAIRWLKQKSWNYWSSQRDDNIHKAFIYRKVKEDDEDVFEKKIVAIDWSKVNRKDRNAIKLKNKEDEKRIRTNFEMFNSYVGKNVLYVHTRQGGGNRPYYPIDTKHPMYLSDCDDYWDSTYCDIYYDLTKGKE